MAKSKKKRELIEWVVLVSVAGIIYLGGWHTEVLGRFQQLILSTKLIQPNLATERSSANFNFALLDIEDQPTSLGAFEGQVIFLNFWATWCPPCIAEMPNIQELYEEKKGDAQFVMISLDKDRSKAKAFIERKGYSFPVYFPNAAIPATFPIGVVPTTYLISTTGEIALRHEGMANYDTEDFKQLVDQLSKTQ